LTAGKYWYLEMQGLTMATVPTRSGRELHVLLSQTEERWTGPDGAGRFHAVDGNPVQVSPGERAKWAAVRGTADYEDDVAALDPDRASAERSTSVWTPKVWDERVGPHTFTFGALRDGYEGLRRLPADPDTLSDAIAEAARERHHLDDGDGLVAVVGRFLQSLDWRGINQEMFDVVGDSAAAPAADPRLVAALYKAAARIPGVELIEHTTDQIGRPGMALALVYDNGTRHDLIFDPATATPLGERWVLARRVAYLDAEPGTVVGARTYLTSGMVSSTEATPEP
jgi:hypothetical protein